MTSVGKLIAQSSLAVALLGTSFPASASAADQGKPASCAVRNAPPAITRMIPATLPPLAEIARLSGTALVRIDLDSNGAVHNPTVVGSSGYAILDDAARASALEQNFSPEVRDCSDIAGTYTVAVEFAN